MYICSWIPRTATPFFDTGGGRKGHRNLWDGESLSWIQPWKNPALHVHLFHLFGKVGCKFFQEKRSVMHVASPCRSSEWRWPTGPGFARRFGSTMWDHRLTCCHLGRWLASPIGQICVRICFEDLQIKNTQLLLSFFDGFKSQALNFNWRALFKVSERYRKAKAGLPRPWTIKR